MEFTETDVLVIGGGMAGCRASLKAKDFVEKVTLVDKAVVTRSGATLWGHVLMAPVPDELFMAWMKEFVEYKEYFSDQEWVEILFREGRERIKELFNVFSTSFLAYLFQSGLANSQPVHQ